VSENVTSARDPSLFDLNGTSVLTYRGRQGTTGRSVLRYLADDGTDWVTDRPFVSSPNATVTFRAPSLVPVDGDSFAAVFTGEPQTPDGRGDVFATARRLRPDPAVNASLVDAASAGDSATIRYELRNLGGRPATGTTAVALVANGTVVDRVTHADVGAGVTVTGRLSGPVSADGRLAVRANASGLAVDQRTDTNDAVTLTAAQPALSVTNLTVSRIGETAVLTAEVANRGGASAANVSVEVRSTGGSVASVSAGRILANDTERVVATVPAAALNDTVTVTADSPRSRTAERLRPFRPDLALPGGVEYRWGGGRLVATVPVANRGGGGANATLRAVDPTTGTAIATRSVSVPPRRPGTSATYTTATVDLPQSVAVGDRVTLTVTAPFESNATDNAVSTDVRLARGPRLVAGGNRSADPDGDGRYEDVDGDGTAAYDDVVALFDAFDSRRVAAAAPGFDFNDNGRLDFDDVVTLFRSVEA
jgi:PKD repeat protein